MNPEYIDLDRAKETLAALATHVRAGKATRWQVDLMRDSASAIAWFETEPRPDNGHTLYSAWTTLFCRGGLTDWHESSAFYGYERR